MTGAVMSLDAGLFQGSFHPFYLAVCPWMVWLCQPVLNAVSDEVEANASLRILKGLVGGERLELPTFSV